MASLIGKALTKRVLKDAAQKNINSSNPFEEQYEVETRDGRKTGKFKTRKRGLPRGISTNDENVLKKVRRRAYRLDMSLFNCCGIRFGWSSVVGIVPVIGDVIDLFLALMVVKSCQKIDGGLPATLRARMMFNVMLDFGLGLIPLLGDVADAVFRANTRNAWLLEMYLTKKRDAQRVGHVSDPELGEINVPVGPGTGSQGGYKNDPPPYDGHGEQRGQQQGVIVSQPEPARVHGRPQPVRSQPGFRYGLPINSNGGERRPEREMVMNAVNYAVDQGVRKMSSQSHLLPGNGDGSYGRSQTSRVEGLAKKALPIAVQAGREAFMKQSRSARRG